MVFQYLDEDNLDALDVKIIPVPVEGGRQINETACRYQKETAISISAA